MCFFDLVQATDTGLHPVPRRNPAGLLRLDSTATKLSKLAYLSTLLTIVKQRLSRQVVTFLSYESNLIELVSWRKRYKKK